MKLSALIIVVFFTLSCASIVNNQSQSIHINTNKPCNIIFRNDTLPCYQTQYIDLLRSDDDISFRLLGDSIDKEITLESSYSGKFILGNLLLVPPFSHLFDIIWSGNKKYSYDDEIYVDMTDESNSYTSYAPFSKYKNKVNFVFTLPEGNHFYQEMQGEYGTQFGFLGLGAGLEYYYSEDQFLSLNCKYIMDFPVFVPAPVDYEAPYPIRSAWALSFTDNYDYNHWILGYGLHYTEYFYAYINMDNEFNNYTEFENYYGSLGPALSINYKLSNNFRLALNYNPSIFRIDGPARIDYSHIFFFEFMMPLEL